MAKHHQVWVRCTRVPLSVWNKVCFNKVVDHIATLIGVDEATLAWENIEYARLKIRIPLGDSALLNHNMLISGQIYAMGVEEDMLFNANNECQKVGTCQINLSNM